MPSSPEEDTSTKVGEYVLGLLDPQENSAMERQLRTDASLRAEYHGWIMRLSGFNAAFAEAPSALSYDAISARLFGAPVRRKFPFALKVAAFLAAAVVITIKVTVIVAIVKYLIR